MSSRDDIIDYGIGINFSKEDLEERCDNNLTAIQALISYGYQNDRYDGVNDVVQLIKLGAKLDVVDDFGNTLLHLIYLHVTDRDIKEELTKLLIDEGLNPNQQNDDGETMFHLLSAYEVDFLIGYCDPNIQDNLGRNALHISVEGDCPNEDIEMICRKIKDINKGDRDGLTPMHYAVQCDECEEIVDILLKYGSKIDSVDIDGNTPLMHCQSVYTIEYLVEKGANINHQNKYKDTILHYLVEDSCFDLEEHYDWMLRIGAKDDIKNRHGITAKDKYKRMLLNL